MRDVQIRLSEALGPEKMLLTKCVVSTNGITHRFATYFINRKFGVDFDSSFRPLTVGWWFSVESPRSSGWTLPAVRHQFRLRRLLRL